MNKFGTALVALAILSGCVDEQEKQCRSEDATVVSIDLFTSTGKGKYGEYQLNNATVKLKRDDGTVCVFQNSTQGSVNTYSGYTVGDRLRKL